MDAENEKVDPSDAAGAKGDGGSASDWAAAVDKPAVPFRPDESQAVEAAK